jgi:hypothetical protein
LSSSVSLLSPLLNFPAPTRRTLLFLLLLIHALPSSPSLLISQTLMTISPGWGWVSKPKRHTTAAPTTTTDPTLKSFIPEPHPGNLPWLRAPELLLLPHTQCALKSKGMATHRDTHTETAAEAAAATAATQRQRWRQ